LLTQTAAGMILGGIKTALKCKAVTQSLADCTLHAALLRSITF